MTVIRGLGPYHEDKDVSTATAADITVADAHAPDARIAAP